MKKCMAIVVLLASTFVAAQSTLPRDFKTVLQYDSLQRFEILMEKTDKDACFEVENSSYTLLALAIKAGATNCFNELLTQNADIEKTCASNTPLMNAAKYGNLTAAKALIQAGANVNAKNSEGKNALDYAKKYEQKELQAYLESL